ncbi:MAG: alpha/beta hydrolase fold domain-containing protein [Rhizobiaceae bacterium]
MPGISFEGPVSLRVSSFLGLNAIALSTYARRAFGYRLTPGWDVGLEIGVRFWRRQFTRAMTATDIGVGRLILDSLQTETPDIYTVDCKPETEPAGTWHIPHRRTSAATILYLHGGGYAFHGAMSRRFAAMLAHHTGAPVFAPDYRLTPEHPHPAQAEDAIAAWAYVTGMEPPERIVVVGDSAGGHMMLTLLLSLKAAGKKQPALGIGLCAWTDIGERGTSMHSNDPYDLVQGWMALRFGEWLDPQGRYGRGALSPICHDFKGLAPLYLQAGGREILCDMIRDFASTQAQNGTSVMLDVWPDMPHDFQLLDGTQHDACQALARIRLAVRHAVDGDAQLAVGAMTEIANGFPGAD